MLKLPDFGLNQEVLNKYLKVLERQRKSPRTIRNKAWDIWTFFDFRNLPAGEVTKEDIEDYADYLHSKGVKKSSQDKYILDLRLFFKWLKPENDFFSDIELWSEKPAHGNKEWVTKSDVVKMLPFCKTQRDRAFLMLLWDSAARIDEVLGLKVGNLKFEDKFCRVTLNGKTGERTIPVTDSVPDLQAWVNMFKGKKDDWLFPSQKGGRLGAPWGFHYLRQISEKAGIDKNVHPHSFRHGRLTELADQGVPEMKLRLFAGWTRKSNMPEIYINTTQKEMEKEILGKAGIETEEEIERRKSEVDTSPKKCPRCGKENPFDSIYCSTCSFVLDTKTALELQETSNQGTQALLKAALSDQELLKELAEKLGNLEKK